jgi:hypothetical protein
MPLKILEVTIIFDDTIRPPGPKMVVAIHSANGWFYRINTKPWRPAVKLEKTGHDFLRHDSYMECGDPLELDDYLVETSLRRYGVIGAVSLLLREDIKNYLRQAKTLSSKDVQEICALLDAC